MRQTPLETLPLEQTRSYSGQASVQALDFGQTEHVIGRIQQELVVLLREREAIVNRIAVIKRTLVGLSAIFGPDKVNGVLGDLLSAQSAQRHTRRSHPGLTDTCRRILRGLSQQITVRQLCDRIEQEEPSLSERHQFLTNSVTVVLKRLVSYGEVLETANEKDGRTWLWAVDQRKACVAEHHLSSPVSSSVMCKESSPADTEG